MAELAMPDVLLIIFADIVPIDEIVRTLRAKQIAAESAMMPPPYN